MAVSPAHIRATSKWEAKAYDKTLIRIRKDDERNLDVIREYATAKGESLNQYILEAVKQRMAREDAIRNI